MLIGLVGMLDLEWIFTSYMDAGFNGQVYGISPVLLKMMDTISVYCSDTMPVEDPCLLLSWKIVPAFSCITNMLHLQWILKLSFSCTFSTTGSMHTLICYLESISGQWAHSRSMK